MRELMLCVGCKRHVARQEPSCPFCGQPIDDAMRAAAVTAEMPRGLSRAQMYAFRAAMLAGGAGALACNDPQAPASTNPTTQPSATATAVTATATTTATAEPTATATATAAATATASASASAGGGDTVLQAEKTAQVKPPPPPPRPPVIVRPPRDNWPPKPYGCVWADPEEPVSV